MKSLLEVKNLCSTVDDKDILKGLNLSINAGEVHVIMGPNGAGKSTLANVIFNSPQYKKTSGTIIFDGKDITNASTEQIAKYGVFMSFQNPIAIEGISLFNFIKTSKSKIMEENVSYFDLKEELEQNTQKLKMNGDLLNRDLNVGFSGGEKKKAEILQLLSLNPKLAILDETDSGLDVDAIKVVSQGIKMFKNDNNAVLIITHSSKILESLNVDYVHILYDGKIIKTGGKEIIAEVEKNGYSSFRGQN